MIDANSLTLSFFFFGTAILYSWLWNSFLVPTLFLSIIASLSSSNKYVPPSDKTVIALCFWTLVFSSSLETFSISTIFSSTNVSAGASFWTGWVSLWINCKSLFSLSTGCCFCTDNCKNYYCWQSWFLDLLYSMSKYPLAYLSDYDHAILLFLAFSV